MGYLRKRYSIRRTRIESLKVVLAVQRHGGLDRSRLYFFACKKLYNLCEERPPLIFNVFSHVFSAKSIEIKPFDAPSWGWNWLAVFLPLLMIWKSQIFYRKRCVIVRGDQGVGKTGCEADKPSSLLSNVRSHRTITLQWKDWKLCLGLLF